MLVKESHVYLPLRFLSQVAVRMEMTWGLIRVNVLLCMQPWRKRFLWFRVHLVLAYLGLRIVQTLLTNKRYWIDDQTQLSPILVICYTNHALDQFLEGIAKFTRNIVRIGSQSKCSALEPFTLMAWKKRSRVLGRGVQQETRSWIFDIQDKLRKYLRLAV
jgi:hypothetical protein